MVKSLVMLHNFEFRYEILQMLGYEVGLVQIFVSTSYGNS